MNLETLSLTIAVFLIVICGGVAWLVIADARHADKWLDESDTELDEWIQRGE